MNAASRVVSTSAVLALVLTAAWLFWPSTLGGGATYVSTRGSSMEPGFSTGDLAILRPAGYYAVGDVVAYSSQSLNTVVMHRIVSGDAGGYVTQGDNNGWLDEDRPAREEILGSLLVRIPQGGKFLDTLGAPGVLPFVGAAFVAFLGLWHSSRSNQGPRASRRRRGRAPGRRIRTRARRFTAPSLALARQLSVPARARTAEISMPTRALARQTAVVSGSVALLAAVGLGVLIALPGTQTDTRTLRVTQQGEFSYSGSATAGTTYPTGVITTGDPVWTRLANALTVSFTNSVTGPDVADLRGAMRLDVVVAADDGWSAVLASGPAVALEDGTATATVVVDPGGAARLLDRHFAEIGASGGVGTLTVSPVAATNGTVEGHAFKAGSPAGLPFTMNAASLRLAGDPDTTLVPAPQTTVEVEETTPRRISVLRTTVPIDDLRTAVAVVLVAALAVLGAAAWIGRSNRRDLADQFLVRHAERIVPVAAFSAGADVIEVSDAESLHRVAERFDTVVLHHATPDEDVFVVRDADATYRFVVPGASDRRRGKPPVPAPAGAAPAPSGGTAPLPRVDASPLWGRVA